MSSKTQQLSRITNAVSKPSAQTGHRRVGTALQLCSVNTDSLSRSQVWNQRPSGLWYSASTTTLPRVPSIRFVLVKF
jgi:hypothetical protein